MHPQAVASLLPFLLLALPMRLKRSQRDAREYDRPPAAARLELDELELALDALQRSADRDRTCLQIHVLPPQSQRLAWPQAHREWDDEDSLQPLILQGL